MAWRRTSLCLFAVWMLIAVCETLVDKNCLELPDINNPVYCDGIFTALPEADLSIECTLNEVTALYTYNGRGLSDINDYGFAWICVSESGEEVYVCNTVSILSTSGDELSFNITERGEWGSSCYLRGCVQHFNDYRHISSNKCILGPTTTSIVESATTMAATGIVKNTTTVASTTVTVNNQTSATGVYKDSNQEREITMWIKKVIAPLIGILIILILVVFVVIIALVSVIQLRMRKYSRNWQAYGNSELPFDPHYTPVDIEKPSFNSTPRLSLLSVDIFQNLYTARANTMNGNLYTEQLSAHPNICSDQSDSCSTLSALDTENESGNGKVTSASSKVCIPHICTSSDDEDMHGKSVGTSSYQSPSMQYIQHLPVESVLSKLPSMREDDHQNDLQTDLLSDLDYVDPVLVGNREGILACDGIEPPMFIDDKGFTSDSSDGLHCLEHNSVRLPFLPDPLSASLDEANVQLDKAYVSSESGYIQSRNTNFSTSESFFIEEDTDNFVPEQRTLGEARWPLIERQSLESPTFLSDNERTKSMDSGLNYYDTGMDTQTGNSEEEVDMLGLDESDITYEEHHGHTDHNDNETGLMPLTSSDVNLDFFPGVNSTGAMRPTSIDLQLVSDYTPSDLSSGYITALSTSYDNSQHNIMEALFQQRLKDVRDELI